MIIIPEQTKHDNCNCSKELVDDIELGKPNKKLFDYFILTFFAIITIAIGWEIIGRIDRDLSGYLIQYLSGWQVSLIMLLFLGLLFILSVMVSASKYKKFNINEKKILMD